MSEPAPREANPKLFEALKGSRIRDENLNRLGKRLVYQVHILLKTSHIHLAGNAALAQPSERLVKTIEEILEWRGAANLRHEGDHLYLDDLRLKMDVEGYIGFAEVIGNFRRREIGSVRFSDEVSPQEVIEFAHLWATATASGADALQELLVERGVRHIALDPPVSHPPSVHPERVTQKAVAKRTYFRTITAVAEVMESAKLKQAIGVKKSKRVVQGLVDLMLQDEMTLLGLTTLRSHDEYTYSHCVNVCILALAIGQRLGYERSHLSDLGIAALFHDVGKAEIPLDILNKATDFTPEEWEIIRRHPILGVKSLLRLKGLDDISTKIVIAGFEHHLNYDLSGYPRLATPRKLTLFGRIISLADCYDAMTASRVYNRIPLAPDKALRLMLKKSGSAYDPLLMKVFVNCMGLYPVGTIVTFDTGERGVVIGAHPSPDRRGRPILKLIRDASGREIDGETIDLADPTLSPARRIVSTADAASMQIDLTRFFL
ncbi:MAG: HD domain-containing protein [Nitrospirae bacterium]|nr:HD domain-containing protein [Nitrospirota bacterium]